MISIRVVSRAGEAPEAPMSATFGEGGGDIGRGIDCTLVLPDPERRISRKHLLIGWRDGAHTLRQIGANLDVSMDDTALAPGVEHALAAGSRIRVGHYVLETVAPPPPARPPERAPLPAASAGLLSARPLLPPDDAEPPPPRAAAAPPRPAERAPLPAAAAGLPPARPLLPPDDAEPPPPRAAAAPLIEPALAAAPPRPSVFHDVLHAIPPPPPGALEVDLLVGESTGATADPLRALFAGLGVTPPARAPAAQAALIGRLLRAAVAGTLELLAARHAAKRELGAGATQLRPRENNPLKFSPDADVALAYLLGPPQTGFIGPEAALRDAYDDLRAHELALVAGMRAALDAVLARFDPGALEQRLAPKALWDQWVPVNRRARLWDDYREQHAQILREIEDDFDSLFARAFLAAYESRLGQRSTAADDHPPGS